MKRHSAEDRARALAAVAEHGQAEAARITSIPRQTIRRWVIANAGLDRTPKKAESQPPVDGEPSTPLPLDTSWHEAFLVAMRETCNVSESARTAGVGRQTAYDHRNQLPDFAAAWDDAEAQGVDALEREARRRALEGTLEPVFHRGEVVGHIRRYSDTLTIFLLKAHRPEKYRERHELTGRDGEPLFGSIAITEIVVEKPAAAGE